MRPSSFAGAALPALVIVLLFTSCKSQNAAQTAGAAAGPPPVPVTIAAVTEESVPVDIHAVGTVEASATVDVRSQVAGQILAVKFTEGGIVNKGDLLFQIDPRPYQEALRQAEATLAQDQARLRQAEANLGRDTAQSKNADAEAGRYQQLMKEGIVSQTQFDEFKTNADALRESMRADQAAIESARAAIESDKAAIDRAKLDLSYCEIRSPITGRAGNLLVHAGNLIRANDENPVVVIKQISPIYVSFGVPERQLAAIRQNSARKLTVEVTPQDSPGKTVTGTLSVIDNMIDPQTGTIRLKATFPNKDGLLWPGQFVNTALTLTTRLNAVLSPSEAVQSGQQGQFVYVVKEDQTVEPRPVTVGPVVDKKIVIESGLKAGETVVTDGQLRLYPGAKIAPVDPEKIESKAL